MKGRDTIILTTFLDYPEVPVSEAGMLTNETGSWRFVEPIFSPRPSPCARACPLGNPIPEVMQLVREGDLAGASECFAWEDPFPALLGRVCPGFCASDCNRVEFDAAVSIRAIERFVGDRFLTEGVPIAARPKSGKGVGVVGSGPAGLSAAYFLTLLGHAVTIFEREEEPGGVPRTGIPPYRLPREVLGSVVERIARMGVTIRTGEPIAPEDIDGLLTSLDALFVSPGAHRSRAMGIPGEEEAGVRSGLEFLGEVHAGAIGKIGGEWLVVGGGNTALDAGRVLLRLGARPTVVYRRGKDEMPAFAEEVEEALEEGVPIRYHRAPVKIERGEDGKLLVTIVGMRPGDPDASGRPAPVPVPGSESTVEVDGVIAAVGEAIDETLVRAAPTTNRPVLIGGDAAGGTRTAAHAAASGKRAAIEIDRRLSGEVVGPGGPAIGDFRAYFEGRSVVQTEPVRFTEINTAYFDRAEPAKPPRVPPAVRVKGFTEIAGTIDEAGAAREASRCFVCGSCAGCEVCATFCPDFSIAVDGNAASIDYAYCKGCGICARECPRGVIVMGE